MLSHFYHFVNFNPIKINSKYKKHYKFLNQKKLQVAFLIIFSKTNDLLKKRKRFSF